MNDNDDLPIFRPKIGKRERAGKNGSVPRFRNSILSLMRRHASLRSARNTSGRARIAVRPPPSWARRVVVKVHITPMGQGAAKAAALHLRYIERDGVEKDGSPGVLYGPKDVLDAASFEPARPSEPHQFRMIVSPEDAGELDLNLYVRRFMAQVERDLGQPLEWAAVNHFDTEHPHAHIVLRGVDRDGSELRLPRAYVAYGLRNRAQEIATEELGPRPELDVARQRLREVTLERFTNLDRMLEKRSTGERIEFGGPKSEKGQPTEGLLMARLKHLETLRLAEKASSRSWILLAGWRERLRELGMRGDIIKQMHRALPGRATHYQILQPNSPSGHEPDKFMGRVVKKGLKDELRGTYFVVVETPSGAGYYLPLTRYAADEVREGDFVRVERKAETWRRRPDEEIARIAKANAGLYDPKRARDEVVSFCIDRGPNAPYRVSTSRETMTPSDIVNAHQRRLSELEKVGLASHSSNGGWRVDQGLLEKLEAKDKTAPKSRLVIHRQPLGLEAQVNHLGPVWLDGVSTDGLAPFGLGAAVGRAIAERERVLRQNNIDPQDPARHRMLRSMERAMLARQIAEETGSLHVRKISRNFRGKVVQIHASPGGAAPYAQVSDGSRFVLVAATRDLRANMGSSVTLSYDAKGRLQVVQSLERGRGDS